jgi:hypothetical protein
MVSGQVLKTMVVSGRSVRMGNEDDGSVRMLCQDGHEDDSSITTRRQDGVPSRRRSVMMVHL